MNRVAVVVDIYRVSADVDRREFSCESGVNIACNSHRQLTVGTSNADG